MIFIIKGNKVNSIMKKILKDKKNLIIFLIISLIAITIRVVLINYKSWDYVMCLEEWFNTIKENGGIFALKNKIGDYNCTYMQIMAMLTYLPISSLISIKIVSIIFDYILAISSAVLVSKCVEKNKEKYVLITYALMLFLPTVFIDSAMWGQCDVIYTSFIVISLIKLIDKKYFQSVFLLGIAFSFKLQFIFILPLYIIIFISNKQLLKKIYYFILIPVVNIIFCLPTIVLGRNIKEVFLIYFTQTNEYNEYISLNIPNIYNLICRLSATGNRVINNGSSTSKIMVLLVAIVYALVLFIVLKNKIKFNKQQIIFLGFWSVLFSVYFLPFMHERYLFIADILSVIIAVIYSVRESKRLVVLSTITVAVLQITSLSTYIGFLSNFNMNFINHKFLSLLLLIIVMYQTAELFFIITKIGIIKSDKENI